jgi:methionyl-tRNA synthetase
MLMAAGLPVQETVFATGFWTIGGEKISKSKHGGKGFRINPLDLAEELSAASGAGGDVAVDAIRYFLLREMPFGADGDFSLEALFRRYNSDLANDLGNLLNRTLTMIARYCTGVIPRPAEVLPEAGHAARLVENYLGGRSVTYMEALKAIWDLLGYLNRYIEELAPWRSFKEGKRNAVDAVMYTLAEGLRHAAIMLHPFMPFVAEQIARQIGWAAPEWRWSALVWGELREGSVTQPAGPLFPRIVEGEAPSATVHPAAPTPAEELIGFEEFARVHLKVGTILQVEKHPKADKLLKIQVDLGEGTPRQIVAGIAAVYPPETLIGRQIVVVANLQPATLRGEVSQGMLLAADMGEDGMAVLMPDKAVPNGSKVR